MAAIPWFDANACRSALPWPRLIEAIRQAFASDHVAPERHIHILRVPDRADATALLMPAWIEGESYGVKLANIFPSNGQIGKPAVNAVYVLFSALTGEPIAMMDGAELTLRRTVATSAYAASCLAREDASHLLIVGAGRLAQVLAGAHAAVRPIRQVTVWARDGAKAQSIAAIIQGEMGLPTTMASDLAAACRTADIISCATLSSEPLIRGAWLKPGTHLDLIGAFKPTMRETDSEAVRRATVFIDTEGGAHAEAGDLIQAVAEGAFAWDRVKGDLAGLARGGPGRSESDEITLFKSVGAALEDLAAARLVAKGL